MRLISLCLLFIPGFSVAADAYPPARFTDPNRIAKMESAFPEIDKIFGAYAADKRIPGMVWGIVIDAQLAHVGSAGVQGPGHQVAGNADHGVSYRLDDEKFHRACDSQITRSRKAVPGGPRIEVDTGILYDGAADAG